MLHAVYGLTDHIGDVCAKGRDAGYAAVAPALYDRHKANVVHPYSRAGADAGIESYGALTEDDIFGFIKACVMNLGEVGGVACRASALEDLVLARVRALELTAQVNFYGSHVPAFIDLRPRCPTIMHYGDSDTIVPLGDAERIKARHPNIDVTSIQARAMRSSIPSKRPQQRCCRARVAALLAFMEKHVASNKKGAVRRWHGKCCRGHRLE